MAIVFSKKIKINKGRAVKRKLGVIFAKNYRIMKLFKYAVILSLLFFGFNLSAQGLQNPFSWRANVKMLNQTEGELIIKAVIAHGWHLYGTDLPKNGPKPTRIDMSKSTGVKFVGKLAQSEKPTVKFDKMFNLKLNYWTGQVVFRQRFKVTDKHNARIIGSVNYMGCNDETCSAPATYNFNKPVVVK